MYLWQTSLRRSVFYASVFDEKKGSVQAEPTKDIGGGNSLGYVEAGDYVKYGKVDFGNIRIK